MAPPREPSFYSFSYTVPQSVHIHPTFAIAGCGEVPEGKANDRDHIILCGDVSPSALREKAAFVLNEQTRRLKALNVDWCDVGTTHVYTIHHLSEQVIGDLCNRAGSLRGLNWCDCRTPVVDIRFEMDCRRVAREGHQ